MNKKKTQNFIIASTKEWHFRELIDSEVKFDGDWHFIKNDKDLTIDKLKKIMPEIIFFPHWHYHVPKEIVSQFECICFHETEVPYGRGGSPIQNLILEGKENTKITALRMTDQFDAGPIYLQEEFNLNGLAEEIYLRSAKVINKMIQKIIVERPYPRDQIGDIHIFKRRKPSESLIGKDVDDLEKLFDFIRMLDAKDYPKANINFNNFIIEFSRPALRFDCIESSVKITYRKE